MSKKTRNPFDTAAQEAADETSRELAGEETRVTTVTWKDVRKMLPDLLDQQHLDELVGIVKSSSEENEKVALLVRNIETLGGVIVKVLSRVP